MKPPENPKDRPKTKNYVLAVVIMFAAALLGRPACEVVGGLLYRYHAPVWVLIVFGFVPVVLSIALARWIFSHLLRK